MDEYIQCKAQHKTNIILSKLQRLKCLPVGIKCGMQIHIHMSMVEIYEPWNASEEKTSMSNLRLE